MVDKMLGGVIAYNASAPFVLRIWPVFRRK